MPTPDACGATDSISGAEGRTSNHMLIAAIALNNTPKKSRAIPTNAIQYEMRFFMTVQLGMSMLEMWLSQRHKWKTKTIFVLVTCDISPYADHLAPLSPKYPNTRDVPLRHL